MRQCECEDWSESESGWTFSALVVVERGKKAKAATHPNLAKFPAKRKRTRATKFFRTLFLLSRITVVYSLTIEKTDN